MITWDGRRIERHIYNAACLHAGRRLTWTTHAAVLLYTSSVTGALRACLPPALLRAASEWNIETDTNTPALSLRPQRDICCMMTVQSLRHMRLVGFHAGNMSGRFTSFWGYIAAVKKYIGYNIVYSWLYECKRAVINYMTNDEADDRYTVQWTSPRTTRHAWLE